MKDSDNSIATVDKNNMANEVAPKAEAVANSVDAAKPKTKTTASRTKKTTSTATKKTTASTRKAPAKKVAGQTEASNEVSPKASSEESKLAKSNATTSATQAEEQAPVKKRSTRAKAKVAATSSKATTKAEELTQDTTTVKTVASKTRASSRTSKATTKATSSRNKEANSVTKAKAPAKARTQTKAQATSKQVAPVSAKYAAPSEFTPRGTVRPLDEVLDSMLGISNRANLGAKKVSPGPTKATPTSTTATTAPVSSTTKTTKQTARKPNTKFETPQAVSASVSPSVNFEEPAPSSLESNVDSTFNMNLPISSKFPEVTLSSGQTAPMLAVICKAIAITPMFLGDQMDNCRLGVDGQVRLEDLKAVINGKSRFLIDLQARIKFLVNSGSRRSFTITKIVEAVYELITSEELSVFRMPKYIVFAPESDIVELEGQVAFAYHEEKIIDWVSRSFTTEFVPDSSYNEELEKKRHKDEAKAFTLADKYRLYVPSNEVFHGDLVRVLLNKKANIAYLKTIVQEHNMVLGRIVRTSSGYELTPDDVKLTNIRYVFQEDSDIGEAKMGSVVICQIVKRHVKRLVYKVVVAEVLGEFERLDIQIKMAISRSGLPYEWNDRVRKQVAKISDEVHEKDKKKRVDLRDLPLVTIDGEDARDFDDAVCCKKEGSGYRLYVAIADVSYYVRTGTPLDNEARHRGNSVYFPNYVVPMLPEKLSNGLCSLNPLVDRLCMVCEVFVGSDGTLGDYSFYPAVMNSHARFTYTEVASILAGNKPTNPDYEPLVPALNNLYDLYKALKQSRTNRGAIEFESEEVRFVFDENLNIADILPVARNDAHMLIEECMIAANVCAAKFVEDHKGETLFRVHARPSETKLQAFRAFLAPMGLSLAGGNTPTSADYAEFVRSIGNHPNKKIILVMMLRSMSLAEYTPDNGGHFGLSLGQYAHFTSPIRRYPDLQLHREIKFLLGRIGQAGGVAFSDKNAESMGSKQYTYEELETLGESCNTTERRADKVTGEVEAALKARFITQFQGMMLPGVVTNVTNFGLFVTIERFKITGLVHVSSLSKDYFEFDSNNCMLIGANTGVRYKLGDKVNVIIDTVETESGHIGMLLQKSATTGTKRKNAGHKAEPVNALEQYVGGEAVDNQEINTIIRTSMARWDNISEAPTDLGVMTVTGRRELESYVPKVKSRKKSEADKSDQKGGAEKADKKSSKNSGKKSGKKKSEKKADKKSDKKSKADKKATSDHKKKKKSLEPKSEVKETETTSEK